MMAFLFLFTTIGHYKIDKNKYILKRLSKETKLSTANVRIFFFYKS